MKIVINRRHSIERMKINTDMKKYVYFLVFCFAYLQCTPGMVTSERPNIILILADDMGFGDVHYYNSESLIPTPNIDRLATEGLSFMNAHSADALCTGSRYAILTGRYAWRTRLKNGGLRPWSEPLIDPDRLTLPEMLKEKGYSTAAIGKWHLGWNWPTKDSKTAKETNGVNVDYSQTISGGPTDRGFDYYFGDDVPNFPPYTFIKNDKITVIPTQKKPDSLFGLDGMMAPGWKLDQILPTLTEKVLEYLNEKIEEEDPYFLYFSLTAPHAPIAPTDQFKGTSQAGLYGDFVHQVDWVVGQICEILEKKNADNTIVIFTSDNGSPGNDGENYRGEWAGVEKYGHKPNGNLRGYKAELWEGGHRIPFIVRWPGVVQSGSWKGDLICQIDLMRMIANVIGYHLPENAGEDSYNMLPALRQQNDIAIRDALVHHSNKGSFAITKGNWKLILTNNSGGWISEYLNPEGFGIKTPGQLYDIKNDLTEKNNLYDLHPEIVNELKSVLIKIIEDGRSTEGLIQQNDSIDFNWEQIKILYQ